MAPCIAITIKEGCSLEMVGTEAEPEITIPIEPSLDSKPPGAVTIFLDEKEMKFVYSVIGRVIAGRVKVKR